MRREKGEKGGRGRKEERWEGEEGGRRGRGWKCSFYSKVWVFIKREEGEEKRGRRKEQKEGMKI